MSKFSRKDIGCKVYCLIHGSGVIDDIDEDEILSVLFPNAHGPISFDLSGYLIKSFAKTVGNHRCAAERSKEPVLYRHKPEIVEKKFKMKKIGWINIFQSITGDTDFFGGYVYLSYEEAYQNRSMVSSKYIDTIQIQYDVEE